jgi:hypothetical protein
MSITNCYALHTSEEEEKAEASKKLSSDADESATRPATLFQGKSDSSVRVSGI